MAGVPFSIFLQEECLPIKQQLLQAPAQLYQKSTKILPRNTSGKGKCLYISVTGPAESSFGKEHMWKGTSKV